KPRRAWMAVAAAVVVAALALYPARTYLRGRDIEKDEQKLFAALPDVGSRAVQGRFSGQNAYVRLVIMRGQNDDKESSLAELNRDEAAAKLVEAAKNDTSPAALRAKALALVHSGRARDALETLRAIPPAKRDAVIWNDLAAIYHANE